MNPPIGCEKRLLPNGAKYLRVHYSADPGKQYSPEERTRLRTELGTRVWDREMEMIEDIYEGKPVFDDYIDELHCPAFLRNSPLTGLQLARALIVPGSRFIGGWDIGDTLSPAFVLCQIAPRPGAQVTALFEVTAETTSLEEFCPLVQTALYQWHPGLWSDVTHVCDPSANQRSGLNKKTALDVAKGFGYILKPSSNVIPIRHSAVTKLLTRRISVIETDPNGGRREVMAPGFYINAKGCPVLHKGFKGAYRYQEHSKSKTGGAGEMWLPPMKDSYSHPQDAFQYDAIEIQSIIGETAGAATVSSRR